MIHLLTDNQRKEFLDVLEKKIGRKLLLIDMDGVIADFDLGVEKYSKEIGITTKEFTDAKMYRIPKFYAQLELMTGAVEFVERLKPKYEIRFLSAPSWNNPSSFTEKRIWIEHKFGYWAKKRMDLTFRKDLFMGHYLVDDRTKYGAGDFIGEHIMFGQAPYHTLEIVADYLMNDDLIN